MLFLGGSPSAYSHGFLPFPLLLWLVSVLFGFVVVAALVCLVASLSGGLALAPFLRLVCFCVWSLWLSWSLCLLCFLLRWPSPSAPPSPWRLVVLISGSEGFPSVVSVWISGCSGDGLGV